MTLGLKGSDSANSPAVAGIYFERRENNPLIHPVFLDDAVDLATLQHIFWRYRHKHFRRRVYAAVLRESQLADACAILDAALQDCDDSLLEHFGEAKRRLPILVSPDTESVVLGAYVRGLELEIDTLVGILGLTDFGFSRKHKMNRSPTLERRVVVHMVAVLPEWRRCGIGRLLIEALEDRVTQRGGSTMIETRGANVALPGRDSFLSLMGFYDDHVKPGVFVKRLAPYFISNQDEDEVR
jgi:GNAT superfamily N-acetyltransferase